MPKGYVAPAVERFWLYIEKTETCWLWTGGLTKGYGHFRGDRGEDVLAHRFAYELLVGRIPDGLELDHLCRVKACILPDHLEPVTHDVNSNRSEHNRAFLDAATCVNGHAWTAENTLRIRGRGRRFCRACNRAKARRIYAGHESGGKELATR